MKISCLAAGIAAPEAVVTLGQEAALRKATPNMLYALAALRDLQALQGSGAVTLSPELGVVLGSSHGELGTTAEFLSHLGRTSTGRPFLFQNSLHNATLGFLTLNRGIQGPAFTLSDHFFSGEDALDLAQDLLQQNVITQCLVIGVETTHGEVEDLLSSTYPPGTKLRSGAGAVLLGVAEAGQGVFLEAIECRREPGVASAFSEPDGYYDANAVERLARCLRDTQSPRTVITPKPNGALSTIYLERGAA